MAGILWRAMVIRHRYLGIVIGLLMAMWFVSGVVMMYVPYSRIQAAEHLHIQPLVPWQSCCNYGALADDTPVARAQVVDHLGTPALRLRMPERPDLLFDLACGARVLIDAEVARKVGLQAAKGVIGQPAAASD